MAGKGTKGGRKRSGRKTPAKGGGGSSKKTPVKGGGPPPEETPKTDDLEMKKKLQQLQLQRSQACQAEVKAVCDKHRCSLVPIITIVGNQIHASMQVQCID